jgi:hypothetical protein
VVDAQQQGGAAPRPLDDVDLPKRLFEAQARAHALADESLQIFVAAGGRQADMVDVRAQVEARVVLPRREHDRRGRQHHAAAEAGILGELLEMDLQRFPARYAPRTPSAT